MLIKNTVIASSLQNDMSRSEENVSIVCVSRDNKSFCINLLSSSLVREDEILPGSVVLSEKPMEGCKIISRVVSDDVFSKDLFSTKCRVIANSLEDKLKSFVILRELRNCL
jgi:hypothetical protein